MAVSNAMFLFEVVVESVQSMVKSRELIIKSDFADIFSLELKDPKQMYIVMPEPPPLPPEPPGKKKAKPKPKGKKGKKGKVEEPPPEPAIQSGQSVLFTSNAEFLIQSMKKFPLELSLWSKEDNFTCIGSNCIPWDPIFIKYLEKIYSCQESTPVTLKEEYNIFEEGTAKMMAKLCIQVKLSYLTEKVTTAFRTLSEDPTVKKVLYTGINSKTTSYMCTLKTTDEDFEHNCNKIENSFLKDKPKANRIVYADYKNAPGANLTFFNEGDYCCMSHADKPPESIYKANETCPDVDFITDYVRKIIVSCNDNMRMLTPRPTITPRVKATDIDKLCYCKETKWPDGKLAEMFKKEAQSEPCPICINAGKKPDGTRGAFDIANIRGPCGRHDCRIARDIRAYIENLVEEDNAQFDINDVIGPCGSKECTLAQKIQEFLRHEGVFSQGTTLEGLSTQCACVKQMQDAITKRKESCDPSCSYECEDVESDESLCESKGCPFVKKEDERVYNVFYFTVEYNTDIQKSGTSSPPETDKSSTLKYCSTDCPSMKASEKTFCSKSACSSLTARQYNAPEPENSICKQPVCSNKVIMSPSPADSEIIMDFNEIHNPCCVKSCDMARKVKDFIVDGVISNKNKTVKSDDPCYCDCVCTFNFSRATTYCAVCGGYECMGDDMKEMPEYAKPHPCPVYHKLYDKKYIKVPSPWPEETEIKKPIDTASTKSSRTTGSKLGPMYKRLTTSRQSKSFLEKKDKSTEKVSKQKAKTETKKVGKFTANIEDKPLPVMEKQIVAKYPYPPVPKNMGWNWTAEDIPGMKPRPNWKPGAANKILVRRYRAVREGVDIIAKKKRAMMQRKKKLEMKPTLIVKKQDGEYTVQMEVFKKYSKERLVFQYPYDEKPPLMYSVGKTEEEKTKIRKQRERRERRETRRKSRLLQSTFRDKCQEICLKAYNQAIGLLPLPNPNDPECPCHTEAVITPPIDSCSCSDDGTISSSDTDGDDWVIEFTPPAARWDIKAKHPPTLAENECQYNYLDYKVKLLDKSGNPVQRFFKGPDGKMECSDLGGFWGPGHIWMDIGKDGYIGPDNRWVPMNFIGPDGMFYSAEEGNFTDNNGQNLKIGVDGYIDVEGKWAWYSKKRARSPKSRSTTTGTTINSRADARGKNKVANLKSQTPPSKQNKKDILNTGQTKDCDGNNQTNFYRTKKDKNTTLVMNLLAKYGTTYTPAPYTPRSKWNINSKHLNKYREIMQGLQLYDDICEIKPTTMANRASNTPNKKISPCNIRESLSNNCHINPQSNSPVAGCDIMIR